MNFIERKSWEFFQNTLICLKQCEMMVFGILESKKYLK